MASITTNDEETNSNKGRMWALHQKLDQPMEEEAVRLRRRYDEKVYHISLHNSQFIMEVDGNINVFLESNLKSQLARV